MATRGSVYKRGDTWTAHVTFNQGGRYRQRKKGGLLSKDAAEKKLTELLASIDDGTYLAPSKPALRRVPRYLGCGARRDGAARFDDHRVPRLSTPLHRRRAAARSGSKT